MLRETVAPRLHNHFKEHLMARINKELLKIRKALEHGDSEFLVDLAPVDDSDLSRWFAVIKGPAETPYYPYEFKLAIEVPASYPMVPPTIKFVSDAKAGIRVPPHCNVDRRTGEICLDILKPEGWSPIWDILHVVQAIHILLQEPVPDSPLDVDMANILKNNDMSAYNGIIRYFLTETDSP